MSLHAMKALHFCDSAAKVGYDGIEYEEHCEMFHHVMGLGWVKRSPREAWQCQDWPACFANACWQAANLRTKCEFDMSISDVNGCDCRDCGVRFAVGPGDKVPM